MGVYTLVQALTVRFDPLLCAVQRALALRLQVILDAHMLLYTYMYICVPAAVTQLVLKQHVLMQHWSTWS